MSTTLAATAAELLEWPRKGWFEASAQQAAAMDDKELARRWVLAIKGAENHDENRSRYEDEIAVLRGEVLRRANKRCPPRKLI